VRTALGDAGGGDRAVGRLDDEGETTAAGGVGDADPPRLARAGAPADALDVAAAVDQVADRPGAAEDLRAALDGPALDVPRRVEHAARRGREVPAGERPDGRARPDHLGDLVRAAIDGDLGGGERADVAVRPERREDAVHPVQPADRVLQRPVRGGEGRHVERDHGAHHRLGVPHAPGNRREGRGDRKIR
jgi:hypothetical protein